MIFVDKRKILQIISLLLEFHHWSLEYDQSMSPVEA